MTTFEDLFTALQGMSDNKQAFEKLLSTKAKDGKVPIQDCVFYLLSHLDCIEKLAQSLPGIGNYGTSTIRIANSLYDVFYEGYDKPMKLKDVSREKLCRVYQRGIVDMDQELVTEGEDLGLITFVSDHSARPRMDPFLLRELKTNHPLDYFELMVGFFVCDKQVFEKKMNDQFKKMDDYHRDWISNSHMVIDYDDLRGGFVRFNEMYESKSFGEVIKESMANHLNIEYRPHQLYTINETMNEFLSAELEERNANILWGHVARSGKSYMMNGVIEEYYTNALEDANCLIVTTAPNETIDQYIQIMSSNIKNGVNVIVRKNELELASTGRNIVIMSKQMLTHAANRELTIPNVKLLMVDEMHFGGTTNLSQQMLNKYVDCHKIFITATYSKVEMKFPLDKSLRWDLEDMELMKHKEFDRLNAKYLGFDAAIETYETRYGKSIHDLSFDFPKLHIAGLDMKQVAGRPFMAEDEWNWTLDTLFKQVEGEYVYEHSIQQIVFHLFSNVIEDVNQHAVNTAQQRPILDDADPSVIMCFVPFSKEISLISSMIKDTILDANEDLHVCICNTLDSSLGVVPSINEHRKIAMNQGKRAVVVLAGMQGHLGVTIPRCDLVIMLNPTRSIDYLFQSMFRCMTENHAKKSGFVIDIDIARSLDVFMKYGYPQNYEQMKEEPIEMLIEYVEPIADVTLIG